MGWLQYGLSDAHNFDLLGFWGALLKVSTRISLFVVILPPFGAGGPMKRQAWAILLGIAEFTANADCASRKGWSEALEEIHFFLTTI